MFDWIGQLVSRRWHWMLLIWLVMLMVVSSVAPQWEDVVEDGEFSHLPEDSPSRVGEKLFIKAYNRDPLGSSVVIVVRRESRDGGLIKEQEAGPGKPFETSDFTFIEKVLKPRLERIKLLTDIIPFYTNSIEEQTEMLAEIEKELNGLPRQSKSALVDDVALSIVADWHSDFFRTDKNENIDPDATTFFETSFYDRISAGLSRANLSKKDVSSRLRKLLEASQKDRTPHVWENASLSLFRQKKREPESIISTIRTAGDQGWNQVLNSVDGKASLVIIELTTEFLEKRNRPIIARIEQLIDPSEGDLRTEKGRIPAGLDLAMSGSATVGRDMEVAGEQSAHATELWTILLVIILLIIIYRAPLLAIIPLVTVGVSVHIALHCLAILGDYEIINLFGGVKTYVTVVLYGAGVDYCVFLMARYKEELDAGATSEEALSKSINNVGSALAASAGTTMVGIGMMVFAEFGKFRQAGTAMSLSIPFVLIASLTFTPAMLRLFGRWAFWPNVQSEQITKSVGWLSPTSLVAKLMHNHWLDRIWVKIGQEIQFRPMTIWLVCILMMLPFSVVGVLLFNHQTYGLLEELPQHGADAPRSVTGTHAVQDHFSAGMTGPVCLLIKNDAIDFGTPDGENIVRQLIERLQPKMNNLHIVDIRGVSHPMGIDIPEPTDLNIIKKRARRQKIHQRYIGTIASPLPLVNHPESRIDSDQQNETDNNTSEDDAKLEDDEEIEEDDDEEVFEIANNVTHINVIFKDDPFSRNSIEQFEDLKKAIPTLLPQEISVGTELHFIGPTASIRDLKGVTGRDQIRVDSLVVLGVFLILVLLLKRVAVSAYLILSVFFSYLVTLGITISFFWAISPGEFAGLDWKVPMFLFTILIAVGEDYNIYLMTRIEEEQKRHGVINGITLALSKTGSIISSCGLIMAGTFASLMAGSLVGMQQLGFALAFGVLLDTFVVRPVLVPTYLILLHSGRFGSFGKLLGTRSNEQTAASVEEDSKNQPASSPEYVVSVSTDS